MTIPTDGPHQYLTGQTADLEGEYHARNGDLIDPVPSSIRLLVTPPNAATIEYLYDPDDDTGIRKDAVGQYRMPQEVTNTGLFPLARWFYRWEGNGEDEDGLITWSEEYQLDVRQSNITPLEESGS